MKFSYIIHVNDNIILCKTNLDFLHYNEMNKKANADSGIRTHAQKSETEVRGQFWQNLYSL